MALRTTKIFSRRFTRGWDAFQARYEKLLTLLLQNRRFVLYTAGAICAVTLVLPFTIGTDFFPSTDTGLMKLHFRAPSGTRLEETEKLVTRLEDRLRRKLFPKRKISTINSMLGIPTSYNLAFVSDRETSVQWMQKFLSVSMRVTTPLADT